MEEVGSLGVSRIVFMLLFISGNLHRCSDQVINLVKSSNSLHYTIQYIAFYIVAPYLESVLIKVCSFFVVGEWNNSK